MHMKNFKKKKKIIQKIIKTVRKEELKILAKDIIEGKIFGTWLMTQQQLNEIARVIFIPIALGADVPKETYHVYAPYSAVMGSHALNGFPFFSSCGILTQSEWEFIREILIEVDNNKTEIIAKK